MNLLYTRAYVGHSMLTLLNLSLTARCGRSFKNGDVKTKTVAVRLKMIKFKLCVSVQQWLCYCLFTVHSHVHEYNSFDLSICHLS